MVGYARVSTKDQNVETQALRLRDYGCERVYTDVASGKLASRPGWDACRLYVREGDTLVATKLDRFSRSVRDLIVTANELRDQGVTLICLDQPIDTASSSGRLFYAMLASFAEFERDLISERTREGLAATTKRGRNGGRKRILKPYQVTYAREQIATGRQVTEVAAELGVSRQTLYRALERTAG
ncbi:MAG: recombinase family protein [Actinobacteria bacterium]|nr:recombinase family protein [Actinomycetota bacterium]